MSPASPTPSPASPNATRDLSKLRIDRAEPERRRVPAWLIATAILLGVLAIVIPWIRSSAALAPEVAVAPALLERAGSGSQTVLAASGYVVARTKAAVSAKLAGRLEFLAVEEGSIVKAGDIIARLENDALRADVEAADASLAQSGAALRRAEADRDLARIEFERQEQLLSAELGTRSARDSARASLEAREAAVAEAQSFVRTSRARREQSRVGLENANVRAPFDGVVLRKEAEVGEYVAPSVASGSLTRGAIVTMADLESLEVEADVAEGNVARLTDSMPAEISLDAVPDRRYRGRLRQVMPTADRQKATVQVKVSLLDPDERVKPEMSAKIQFLSSEPDPSALTAPPIVTAPSAAIQVEPGEGAFAWIVEGGRVRRAALTLGDRRGERIVVTSGLAGSEMLVLDPPPSLAEGASVKVKSP